LLEDGESERDDGEGEKLWARGLLCTGGGQRCVLCSGEREEGGAPSARSRSGLVTRTPGRTAAMGLASASSLKIPARGA
jgi:hypothetical protein